METITNKELDVMMAIWDFEEANLEPAPTGFIRQTISQNYEVSLQTIQVVLRRLVEKEFISCSKGPNTNLHSSIVKKEEYIMYALDNFISHHYKYHDNPSLDFLKDIIKSQMSNDDICEIANYLDMMVRKDE